MAGARTRSSRSGSLVTIDLSELREFSAIIRQTSPKVYRALGDGLREAGMVIADEARARSSTFSTRIPASIRVRKVGIRVSVTAGDENALDAAPLENKGIEGFFRHPVFGNRDVWVNQQAHPYLRPAAEAQGERTADKVLESIARALDQAGFK